MLISEAPPSQGAGPSSACGECGVFKPSAICRVPARRFDRLVVAPSAGPELHTKTRVEVVVDGAGHRIPRAVGSRSECSVTMGSGESAGEIGY